MKLILDFDDVLFKASGLKERIFSTLVDAGIQNGQELYERERATGTPFSLRRFLYRVFEQNPTVRVDIDIMYERIMSECQNLINHELVEYLELIGKESCYIVTNGDQDFQQDKIARTELDQIVKQFVVVPGSKREAIEAICKQFGSEQVVFADDKSAFFSDLGDIPNLVTVEYRGDDALKRFQQKIQEAQMIERDVPQARVTENKQGMSPKMS
jgi:FMN phosphatase YigB (HAD superfamily)